MENILVNATRPLMNQPSQLHVTVCSFSFIYSCAWTYTSTLSNESDLRLKIRLRTSLLFALNESDVTKRRTQHRSFPYLFAVRCIEKKLFQMGLAELLIVHRQERLFYIFEWHFQVTQQNCCKVEQRTSLNGKFYQPRPCGSHGRRNISQFP